MAIGRILVAALVLSFCAAQAEAQPKNFVSADCGLDGTKTMCVDDGCAAINPPLSGCAAVDAVSYTCVCDPSGQDCVTELCPDGETPLFDPEDRHGCLCIDPDAPPIDCALVDDTFGGPLCIDVACTDPGEDAEFSTHRCDPGTCACVPVPTPALMTPNFSTPTPGGATTATPTPVPPTATPTPVPGPLDHFKCWKVKDLKEPKFEKIKDPGVDLDDQFGAESDVDVVKPFMICNPASKNGSGINNAQDHLCCYKVKGQKLEPARDLEIVDQFGTYQWEAKGKPKFLCQPCDKTVLTP